MARKVIQRTFGGPDVLEVVDTDPPDADALRSGEMIVMVAAASLNAIDYKTRRGGGVAALMGELPITVGWDLAGAVEAVAPDVTTFHRGERVLALSRFPEPAAAYSQYAIVDAADCVSTPDALGDDAAAALPLAALTAWQGVEQAHIEPGQRVLIHGAGGGVGHLAVQMVRDRGAHIIATASAAKREWLTSLGADYFIDYGSEDFVDVLAGSPVDAVLDFVAGPVGVKSVAVVKPGGRLLQFPSGVDPVAKQAADRAGVGITGPVMQRNVLQLADITRRAALGTLRPTLAEVYELDAISEAHTALEAGHVSGKLVVNMWS